MKLKRYLRLVVLALLLPTMLLLVAPALAATLPSLGTAASFGSLAGTTVTNTSPTHVIGDVGVSPGSAIVGFPPGTLTGVIHAGDPVAAQAQNDVTAAYNNAAGQSCDTNLSGQDLGGKTLVSGVYCFNVAAQLTGQLTLDGQGNANSVFIFQIGSTLTTASNASVLLINGAQACRVFWQIGSSATLGTNTGFKGNILALTSITLNTSASSDGGLYARNGAITLDNNNIQACGNPPLTLTPTPSPANTLSPTSTPPPGSTNTPTPPGSTNTPTPPGSTNTPTPPQPDTSTPTPTQPNTDTPTPQQGYTGTPTLQPGNTGTATPQATNTPTVQLTPQPTETLVPISTQVAATQTAIAINTQVMTVTITPAGFATITPGAGMTSSTTPRGPKGSVPGLPHTGSSLGWFSPLTLLLGALLLAAGLCVIGLRRQRLG